MGCRWHKLCGFYGAKVINLNLGGPEPSTTLEDAVKNAYTNGVTIVAATGNDGKAQLSYPAAYDDYVIAVGGLYRRRRSDPPFLRRRFTQLET